MRCPDRECCGCDLCYPPELEDIEPEERHPLDELLDERPAEPVRRESTFGEVVGTVVLFVLVVGGAPIAAALSAAP